jgi:hypothetical protein
MTDKPDRKRRRWKRAAWVAAALLLLYPLSSGPAAWACYRIDPMNRSGLKEMHHRVYTPVMVACRCRECRIGSGARHDLRAILSRSVVPGSMRPKCGFLHPASNTTRVNR